MVDEDKKGTSPPAVAQDEESRFSDTVKLDEMAQTLIGRQLALVYGEVLEQPIPDHFIKLLDELEKKERGR